MSEIINKELNEYISNYTDIVKRMERFAKNTTNTYILPTVTYELAITEIEKYLKELDNHILKVKWTKTTLELEPHILITVKKLDMLKSQFITLWNRLKGWVKVTNVFLNNDTSKVEKVKWIESLEKLNEVIEDIAILNEDIKIYKSLQRNLWVKLNLDDKIEEEMEKEINFIPKQIQFVNYFNSFMKEYLWKLDFIRKYEMSNKVIYLWKIKKKLESNYTLPLTGANNDFIKDLNNNSVLLENIIDNIHLLENLEDKYRLLLNVQKKINFVDDKKILEKSKIMLNQPSIKDGWIKESAEIKVLIENIDNFMYTFWQIHKAIKDVEYEVESIEKLIKRNTFINKKSTDKLLIKYHKPIFENYYKIFLNNIKYSDLNKAIINDIEKYSKKVDEYKVRTHINEINNYFENIVPLFKVDSYILSMISNELRQLKSYNEVYIEITKKKSLIVNKYKEILNSKKNDIIIWEEKTITDFVSWIYPIKNALEKEVGDLLHDIKILLEINSTINNYTYRSWDSIERMQSDLDRNVKSLLTTSNLLSVASLWVSMYNVYNNSKSEYEKEQERQRLIRKRKREEEARRKREEEERREEERRAAARRASYSSSSSYWSSSSSWGSSSSSSSSFSSSYGWSDSF